MLDTIALYGQIADLKDVDYKNTLALAVLIELLEEKGIFTQQEFMRKARELEACTPAQIAARRKTCRPVR